MTHEIFNNFKLVSKVDTELIDKYEKDLPSELINVWKQYGFGEIMDGYLKIINPEDYIETLEMSYYASDKAIPVMVTGFGDLIVWESNKYLMMIKYKDSDIECLSSTMEWFWDDLSDEEYTNDYFELRQYKKAVTKLGELTFEECFGYTPLLGMGGSKKIANLDKVMVREHIEVITSLTGRIE